MTISQSVAICNSSNKPSRRLYDHLYKDLAYVTRANEPTKLISPKARIVLANLVMMISRNSEMQEFVDHSFLSSLTHCSSSKQNANILSQLADIIDYQYHCCTIFQDKRKVFGYVVKFTADGAQRIKNPRLFYSPNISSTVEINFDSNENKSLVQSKKISTLYISNKYYTNNNLNNNSYSYSKSNCDEFEEKEEVAKKLPPVTPTANLYYEEKRSLKKFHPISEEDGLALCKASERSFDLDYINDLLLKLSVKNSNHSFYSKEVFLCYMTKILKGEMLYNEQSPATQSSTVHIPTVSLQIEAPVIDQTTPWGKLRASLRNHYGDAIDRSWFGKLVPVESTDSSKLVLKAPTNFICSYIEQHYLHTIKQFCSAQKYSFSLTV